MPEPIRQWPPMERPRERLVAHGSHVLSDAELLAVFLGTGCRGASAIDLARTLLKRFGGIGAVLEASPRKLFTTPGMGIAKVAKLKACLELGQRYLRAQLERGDVLARPEDSGRFVAAKLRHHRQEVFAAVFLDSRHRVLGFEELFFGTIDGTSVHPREIIRRALDYNAAALIVAHNHPSGVGEPSAADVRLTARLREALALVDVRLIDHLIVAGRDVVSLAERGHV